MMLGRQTDGVVYEKEDCVERLELTDNWRSRVDWGTSNGGDRWGCCSMDEEPAAEMDAGLVSRDKDGTGSLGSVGDKGLFDADADDGFLRDWIDGRDCSTGAEEVE
jgi:hypothetical protein